MEFDFYGWNKGNRITPHPVESPDNTHYDSSLNFENGERKPKPTNIREKVGPWELKDCGGSDGNEALHYTHSEPYFHCAIHKVKNGYYLTMGISRPAGAVARRVVIQSLEDAYNYMEVHDMRKRTYGKYQNGNRFANQTEQANPDYGILTWGLLQTSAEDFEALKKRLANGRYDYDENFCSPGGILAANIDRSELQNLSKRNKTHNFIYGERVLDAQKLSWKITMEFWEYEEITKYNITGQFQSVTEYFDCSEAEFQKIDDFAARHGFSFTAPFSQVLSQASQDIFLRYPWKDPRQFLREAELYLCKRHKFTGQAQWSYRARMYHAPLDWEGDDGAKNSYYEMWKEK